MKATLHMLRHNRPLAMLCSLSLLMYTGVFGAIDAGIVPKAVGTIGKKWAYIAARVSVNWGSTSILNRWVAAGSVRP